MYRCQNEKDGLIEILLIDNMLFFGGLCYYSFSLFLVRSHKFILKT